MRALSDVFHLTCRSDARRTCSAALGLAAPQHPVQPCRVGRSPDLLRLRTCSACASVSVAYGVIDNSCCHVPGGSWAERCGEAVGEASCGDDGLQPCEYAARRTPHAARHTPHALPYAQRPTLHARNVAAIEQESGRYAPDCLHANIPPTHTRFTWLEGWQACNLGSLIATTAGAAVRSTIGFADGWAATTFVQDAHVFATRVLGATGAWADGAEVSLHRLAAFAHTMPIVPCIQAPRTL